MGSIHYTRCLKYCRNIEDRDCVLLLVSASRQLFKLTDKNKAKSGCYIFTVIYRKSSQANIIDKNVHNNQNKQTVNFGRFSRLDKQSGPQSSRAISKNSNLKTFPKTKTTERFLAQSPVCLFSANPTLTVSCELSQPVERMLRE